jgi:antitoxin component HigA of HigAB toxin-antitoxin module
MGSYTMPSLKQLEQQKAELDFKITQSMEILKKMDLDLEQARLRQQAIDEGTAQIMAVLEKYNLTLEDIFPGSAAKATATKPKESQTLAEMRQYFNRR